MVGNGIGVTFAFQTSTFNMFTLIFFLLTISIFILASLMDGWRLQIVFGSPGDSLLWPLYILGHFTATCHYQTNTDLTQIHGWKTLARQIQILGHVLIELKQHSGT